MKKIIIKASDCLCFVCDKPIKLLHKHRTNVANDNYDAVVAKKLNDSVTHLGKKLFRHNKCEAGSTNWMKKKELREMHLNSIFGACGKKEEKRHAELQEA